MTNTQNMLVKEGLGDNLELNYLDNELSAAIPILTEADFSDIVLHARNPANIELTVNSSDDGVSRLNTITS